METALMHLQSYGRLRELEILLPQMRQQLYEDKYNLREIGVRVAAAKWELDKAEKDGFFQRILGKTEERKEKAWREYREARAEEDAAKRELEQRKQEMEALEAELEGCKGSWEAYLAARGVAPGEEERSVLARLTVWEINGCLTNLEEARPWMQADVRSTRIRPDNQKLHFLGKARDHAAHALEMLRLMPEGSVEIPGYLLNPDGFIMGVTMRYKELDRLNLAQEQLRRIRNQIKESV